MTSVYLGKVETFTLQDSCEKDFRQQKSQTDGYLVAAAINVPEDLNGLLCLLFYLLNFPKRKIRADGLGGTWRGNRILRSEALPEPLFKRNGLPAWAAGT